MINIYYNEFRFAQCMTYTRKSEAMYHHTGTAGDGITRQKMCPTIANIHRGDMTLIFVR